MKLLLLILSLFFSACQSSKYTDEYKISVQVIILRDNKGAQSAPYRLDKELINGLYSAAGVKCEFSEPRFWDNYDVLKGLKSLNEITREAEEASYFFPNKNILYMFFVEAVDGKQGPLGRGLLNGNIVYIGQGSEKHRFRDAFVIAHEMGHNLNLKHSVDDPSVPSEITNIMGDGPFEERLKPSSLHPSQIETIHKSRLLQKINL